MKKSTPLLLLTIFSAVCMAFSLTACGDDGSELISVTENGSSKNSGLTSEVLSSQEEWDAVLDGSKYNNFTASVTSTYKNSNNSNDNETRTGTAKYDFTSGTYLTGNYASASTYQYKEYTSETTTETHNESYVNYFMLSDDAEKEASYTAKDDNAGKWTKHNFNNGMYTPYSTQCLEGMLVDNIEGAYINGTTFQVCGCDGKENNILPIYGLLVASYTDAYSGQFVNSTAAEYKDGSYVCRYGDMPMDEDRLISIMVLMESGDVTSYECYCDCYVKVNEGHISYIKLEYVFSVYYSATTTVTTASVITQSQTVEWSFYDFGTTAVTVPNEVNALFE